MTTYPGYRTMTGAQRYNARMEKIWTDAYEREARKAGFIQWRRARRRIG